MAEVKPITPTSSNVTAMTSKPSGMGAIAPMMPTATAPRPATASTATTAKPAAKSAAPAKKPAKAKAKSAVKKSTPAPAKKTFATKAAPAKAATKATGKPHTTTARPAAQKSMDFSASSVKKVLSDSAQKFTKATDTASRGFSDAMEKSRSGMEAAMESGNVTADMTRAFTSEMFRFTNESFSDNMEISKEIFNCKTLTDVLNMNSKMMRSNIDLFFNQSSRMSDMFVQFVTDASEPLTQQIAEASKTMQKSFKA